MVQAEGDFDGQTIGIEAATDRQSIEIGTDSRLSDFLGVVENSGKKRMKPSNTNHKPPWMAMMN
jgi:hypothetical protein